MKKNNNSTSLTGTFIHAGGLQGDASKLIGCFDFFIAARIKGII